MLRVATSEAEPVEADGLVIGREGRALPAPFQELEAPGGLNVCPNVKRQIQVRLIDSRREVVDQMKLARMIGLTLIAVIAAMAFIGASTASAVTACKENITPCPSGKEYTSGTVVKAELIEKTVAELKAEGTPSVNCKVSASEGKSTATSGSPLPGLITNLTFEQCATVELVPCTVTVVHLNPIKEIFYNAEITANEKVQGNGFLTVTKSTEGNPGATVVCGTVVNCTFTTASAKLSITGGEPAKLDAEGIVLERSGTICPTKATWTAHYKVTAPTVAWIEKAP